MSELFSGLAIGVASPAGLIFSSLVLLAIGLLIAQGVGAAFARQTHCRARRSAPTTPRAEMKEKDYRRAA